MLRILISVLFFSLLLSCTPEGRLRRLLRQNPHLIKVDTVKVIDTTIVIGSSKDTIVSLQRLITSSDTIIIRKERLTVKMIYNNDSVYVSGECATDTIFKFRDKYVYKVVAPKEKMRITDWLVIIAVILLLSMIIKQFRTK